MFDVFYNNEFHKVYSVRDNQDTDLPDFLIYINYHWVWISCIHCMPRQFDYERGEYCV